MGSASGTHTQTAASCRMTVESLPYVSPSVRRSEKKNLSAVFASRII